MSSLFAHLVLPRELAALLFSSDKLNTALIGLLRLMEITAASAMLYLGARAASSRWTEDEPGWQGRALLIAVIAGSVAAITVAYFSCGGPFLLPGTAGMLQAAEYVLATAVAGSGAAVACWLGLENRPRLRPLPLLWLALSGWVLLPCMMMLAMGHSPAALPVTLTLVTLVVAGVRRMAARLFAESQGVWTTQEPLASFAGLRLDHWAWKSAAVAALCAAVAGTLAAAEWTVAACVVLMLGAAIVAWRWSAALRRRRAPREWTLRLRAITAAVVSVAAMLLMQQIAPRLGMVAGTPAIPQIKPVDKHSYFSVVLLPPPEKKRELQMPQPKQPGMHGGKGEPVVIPFDGPYWYFQPPLLRPDDAAHVARGRAAEVNVHSVDDDLLLMEAHQPLIKPVELSCCSEIDVALTNSDPRPGLIAVEVVLRDSSDPKLTPLMLTPQTLRSSEDGSAMHGSVEETLHFPLAAYNHAKLHRFDEIDVLFLPTMARRRSGSKVEIRSFTLQP